jgi:hypothetical protein
VAQRLDFKCPQRLKSKEFKSGELAGHALFYLVLSIVPETYYTRILKLIEKI